MAITSATKMRGAVDAAIDYSFKREQTILFQHRDAGWLQHNIEQTRLLIEEARAGARVDDDYTNGRFIIRGVPSERVLRFLRDYRMHPNAIRLRTDLLMGYIGQQKEQGGLLTWNLVVIENPNRAVATGLDVGIGRGVRTNQRSRLERYSVYANIKSLVSRIDRIADVGVSRAELPADVDPEDDLSLARYRQDVMGSVGLLCIYPIDKDSKVKTAAQAKKPRDPRVDLNAEDHVIGLGIYFPQAVGEAQYRYKSANVQAPIEEDTDDFDQLEAADEVAAVTELADMTAAAADAEIVISAEHSRKGIEQ